MSADRKPTLFVTVRIMPGSQDAVLAALAPAVVASNLEPGCLRYEAFSDEVNDLELVVVQQWASEQAHEEHRRAPHEKELMDQLGPHLAGPPAVRQVRQVALAASPG